MDLSTAKIYYDNEYLLCSKMTLFPAVNFFDYIKELLY